MPDWATQLLLLLLGSSPLSGILAWWMKARFDRGVAQELAQAAREEALQKEVKDGLNDRIRDEIVRRQSVDQTMQVLQAQQRLMEQAVELLKTGKGSP
jgi:transcription initiation factor TFIID subunit TAF12